MQSRFVAALATLALGVGTALLSDGGGAEPAAAAPPPPPAPAPGTYTNPVTEPFADTYADPAVIRGKDGWWYLYATSDPLVSGGPFGNMHVARSRDLAAWEYVGTIFDEGDLPAWAAEESFFWAPDIRYVGGQYVMYYTVTDTAANPDPWDYTIGVATAPTPTGPWTDSGGPVLDPRPAPGGGYLNTIDPALLSDDDGTQYLYFGGFNGGIWVTELDETGTRAVGEPTRVTANDRYEGAFVVKRDGWYYLMGSSANCCAGPVTGYSVYTGRSRSPLGPFVDHEGVGLDASRVGGTQVVAQNGNRWIGVGHHAVLTDASGQDWMLYHAIDRDDAWLDEPGGVNRRPTLMDRMDWIDGWPVVNAGAGPSEGPQPAPVAASELGLVSVDPASGGGLRRVAGTLARGTDDAGDAGAVARLVPGRRGPAEVRTAPAPRDVRLEADVRLPEDAGSFTATVGGPGRPGVDVRLDADARELVVTQGHRVRRAALPDGADLTTWHVLTVTADDGAVVARLSSSGLGDADAEVRLPVAGLPRRAPVHLAATGAEAQLDNLTVVAAHDPVTERVAEPRAGAVTFAEDFSGELDAGWAWLHGPADVTLGDGSLAWPLTGHDLVGEANDAPALLRDAPEGDYVLETTVTLPLGEDTVRNYQQAGLLVHAGDDDFLRLSPVSIWQTRQVEFGKELTADGRWWGGHLSGPVADTMHLRLFHTTDPATGEHRFRAASSRDGRNWRPGATWTLPADTDPRIGIYAGGGASPAVTAVFDEVLVRELG
ncbi:family 43 glycosylhydrolase [Promicromonospora citrea]|uniref:Glycosyl hydrolase family 43 n=2 Tax=Promicromonospora citrea TaxID=43677 RepID=A0A8H9L4V0_9MICO|nr:family 43 glycosylhydrolase [Promicromonospora citrea]GGM34464.1 hypothetical protein GCM10010102_32530 [Promicromonospora citrea]